MVEYEDVELGEYEVLAKKSYVDNAMKDLGVTIVDELQKIVFVRIVRVGNGLIDSEALRVGYLITIHKGVAKPIPDLTIEKRCPHYIVTCENVVALIREFEKDLY